MALISSIKKHAKGKLAEYLKQAKKLFDGIYPICLDNTVSVAHLSITGSPDGDRTLKTNKKAKVPREISSAPNIISEPATTTAIIGAHVGDTEVVPNVRYDYNHWVWNELPLMPSEPPSPPKPSTASAPKLKSQEPTVDEADKTLLEIATIGDSIARIFESTSDPSVPSSLSTTITHICLSFIRASHPFSSLSLTRTQE